jgi:hypothetical protein
MEEMTRGRASPPTKAFEYLRNEAIDAHLAGDGMRVLHLCTIALENMRRPNGRDGQSALALDSVRWAFFLNLYWMLDDWVAYSNDDLFNCVTTDDVSSWDRKLYEYVLTPLKIPLNFDSTDELRSAPAEWLTLRCNATEDVAALTFAIELTWYKDSQSSEWRELAANWLAKLSTSPLKTEIEQLLERLTLQSSFCGMGHLGTGKK